MGNLVSEASQNASNRVSLRFILASTFVLQVLTAVGLTAFFSIRSGQDAIQGLAQQLQSEVSDRVQDRIHTYLTTPGKVNEISASAFRAGRLDPRNLAELERHFLDLHRLFDTVNHVSFGNQNGDYVAVRRSRAGVGFEVLSVDRSKNTDLQTFRADSQGQRIQLIRVKSGYDPRTRPWYEQAVKAKRPGWSSVYTYFRTAPLGISHTYPVYDGNNSLQGVLATDFDLKDISRFLNGLKIAQSGAAFILERNGNLVAISTLEELAVAQSNTTQRIQATQSQNPAIANAARYLQAKFPNLATFNQARQLTLKTAGDQYFLQVVPLKGEPGIEWLLAVVIPEADFLEQVQKNHRTTLLLCLGVLVATTLVAIRTSRWVVQPILHLTNLATTLSSETKLTLVPVSYTEIHPSNEIGELARVFNQMAEQLRQSSTALEQTHQNFEQQIEQRTAEIQQTASELTGLFAAMTELIFVMDTQGRYLKIAPTNPTLLVKPIEELLDKTLHEVFPTEQADQFLKYIQQALRTKQVVTTEYSFFMHGEEHWFAASISPITDEAVIWVVRDISDRKRAEAALQLSEEKFAKAFHSSPNLIVMTTLDDDRLVEVNDSFLNTSGYVHEEVIGKTALDLNLWVDLDARKVMLQQLQESKAFSNQEYEFRAKSGEIRTGLLSAESITISGVEYGLYVVNDITDRKRAEEALRAEQFKSEQLLLNILPKSIADQLKQNQQTTGEPAGETYIAEQFDEVTILFADIVGFTHLSTRISPTELVALLNRIFSVFDDLSEQYGLEKIKTIGDAYMVVGGLPDARPDHAEAIANMALDMQREVRQFRTQDNQEINIRIGINTGAVVAGVIGIKKFIYDLWGDTVNIASRMESQGEVGQIQVTEATYERLKDRYQFEPRGRIDIRGKGPMLTYWLLGKHT